MTVSQPVGAWVRFAGEVRAVVGVSAGAVLLTGAELTLYENPNAIEDEAP